MEKQSNQSTKITPFAITNYRDIKRRFGIKEKNRRGHMYLIGQTGTGKSTLMENMAISDIKDGNGLAVIDPHGDLAEDLLDHIPRNRISDVIYFNPADLEYPIAFNPLDQVHPDYHFLVVSGLISVFKKIWSEFWGPRLEHILRHSLLTLLAQPSSTLLDLPRLLTDKDYRGRLVGGIKKPEVKAFWYFEFEKYSAWLRSEAISPILNKIGQFVTSDPLRNVVGQRENSFSMKEVMDEGKILIINLAKGQIGEDNSSLFGAMIATKIYLTALSRVGVRPEKRNPFYLYLDEFQNFLTLSVADMLSESRKYGLNLILAHQYLEQLDEKIRAAVLGNVGTIVSFRVGVEDAGLLKNEFFPVFNKLDLINLPNYSVYLKMLIDGVTSRPFSATTLPPVSPEETWREEIIEASRRRYSKNREEVRRGIQFGESESQGERNMRLPLARG